MYRILSSSYNIITSIKSEATAFPKKIGNIIEVLWLKLLST
jgi:hypothetical protein